MNASPKPGRLVSTAMNGNAHQLEGWALVRSALPRPQVAAWLDRIDEGYEALASEFQKGGLEAVHRLIGPGQRYQPTASSMTIGAVLDDEAIHGLLAIIKAGPAGEWIARQLGRRVTCNLDQSWIRRQYAPAHYPRDHAPHGWHQDGALRCDFQTLGDVGFPPEAMLNMVTCWIAFTPCGETAPGLEMVQRRFDKLFKPTELADPAVQARHGVEDFLRPVMQVGDAMLFRGDVLHRTHVTPSMTADRSSLELRFFAEDRLPARLKGDRYL